MAKTEAQKKISLIGKYAKETRGKGEAWPAAIKRATKELKAKGKI